MLLFQVLCGVEDSEIVVYFILSRHRQHGTKPVRSQPTSCWLFLPDRYFGSVIRPARDPGGLGQDGVSVNNQLYAEGPLPMSSFDV
jgi:hypothetical protein